MLVLKQDANRHVFIEMYNKYIYNVIEYKFMYSV